MVERKAAEGICAFAQGMSGAARGCEGGTGLTSVVCSDPSYMRQLRFAHFDQAIVYRAKQWRLNARMALIPVNGVAYAVTRIPLPKSHESTPTKARVHTRRRLATAQGVASHSKGIG